MKNNMKNIRIQDMDTKWILRHWDTDYLEKKIMKEYQDKICYPTYSSRSIFKVKSFMGMDDSGVWVNDERDQSRLIYNREKDKWAEIRDEHTSSDELTYTEQKINIPQTEEYKRGDVVAAWDDAWGDTQAIKVRYTGGRTHTGKYICEPLPQPIPGIEQVIMYDNIDYFKEEPTLRDKIENYIESYDNNELSLDKTLNNIMSEINKDITKLELALMERENKKL